VEHADATQPSQRWYGANLVGVPAQELASTQFNAHPRPLAIAGTFAAHRLLFELLDDSRDLMEAHAVFEQYLNVAFGLNKPAAHGQQALPAPDHAHGLDPSHAQRRWRSSWRRLLQGWGMDSNGAAGAVLKGWVESRFGLAPSFHKAPLQHFPSPAWVAYLNEKAGSRYNNNSIHQQLDLLYAYCQWALRRVHTGGGAVARHLRLWRGSNQCEEQLVAGRLQNRRCTLRLNNVVSFSLSQEDASCFGDWVLEVQVPRCKVIVFPELLPGQVLTGEQEVLALGGDFEVTARYV
jgi:NAD+--dinitrogen-reductase ADP-D-ribosyltransferase